MSAKIMCIEDSGVQDATAPENHEIDDLSDSENEQ